MKPAATNDRSTALLTLSAPRMRSRKPTLVAGLGAVYAAGTGEGIPGQWRRFAQALDAIPARMGRVTYGVVSRVQGDAASAIHYLTGIAVADVSKLPPEYAHLQLPGGDFAVFEHCGHVSTLPTTCAAIFEQWLPQSGYRLVGNTPFFERYDEAFDPATGLGVVEVWVPVQLDQGGET